MAEAEVIKATKMTEEELLIQVIDALGLTETHHKKIIKPFFNEVKFNLFDGGVKSNVILSSASVGVFIRGVSDLWNYGSGGASLSPYYRERVIQLATSNVEVIEAEEVAENGQL